MGNLKKYAPFVFAVIFASLASLSVYHFLNDRGGGVSQAASVEESVSIVVAKESIPLGKRIAEEDLKLATWPRESIPEESFRSAQPLVGKIAKDQIVQNEPVLSSKLMGEKENFSSLIPAKMRGVTIPLRYSQALAEILERGAMVDVISIPEDKPDQFATKVIAQNVRVLSVHKGLPGADTSKELKNMEVTLVVTPKQAEWILTALTRGSVQVVVRNAREDTAGSEHTTTE